MGVDDSVFRRQTAIISSMTRQERRKPDILKASRKKRIAAGSGTRVEEVNKLLKMHRQISDMMKQAGRGKGVFGRMMGGVGAGMPQMDPAALQKLARGGGLPGGLPGTLPGNPSGGLPGLSGLGGAKLPGLGGGLPGLPKKK
jgi:signal recognition particle subunit SRP54